jgi:hypothetical protein
MMRPRSADSIKASGHVDRTNRPDTCAQAIRPSTFNRFEKVLASRGPSTHAVIGGKAMGIHRSSDQRQKPTMRSVTRWANNRLMHCGKQHPIFMALTYRWMGRPQLKKSTCNLGQVLPYFREKLPRAVGLGHIIVAAGRTRLLLVSAQGIRGDRNDRDCP